MTELKVMETKDYKQINIDDILSIPTEYPEEFKTARY